MPDANRSMLRIPDPVLAPSPAIDARDPQATFPPIEPVRPPVGALNVLVVVLDEAAEDLEHLSTPEERFRIAVARQ